MSPSSQTLKIRVGVSSCLLGERVRWDGNHKHDHYLTDILGPYVEWVPVCPEVEAGMGIPRETVQLVGLKEPRMLGTQSRKDWTEPMQKFTRAKLRELSKLDLAGFILKRGSPSCGIKNVILRTEKGMPGARGDGLFAAALMEAFPALPVEDEGRLNDPSIRENFIIRLFAFKRLRDLFGSKWKSGDLVAFHTRHKYLLLAHSQKHYRLLGQLVSNLKKEKPSVMEEKYSALFMEAFALRATRRKNVNVLQHMHGYFRGVLDEPSRCDLLQTIEDYQAGLIPLIVPVTLLRHYVNKLNMEYLKDQVYLNPHPKELMLRNHV